VTAFWLKNRDPARCCRRVTQPPHIAGPLGFIVLAKRLIISKMKKLNFKILFVLSTSIFFSSYSQPKKFNLVDLKDKTWNMVGLINASNKEYYENDKVFLAFNEKYVARMEYYLSDSICRVFDSKQVGNVLSGTYIIRRPLRDKKHPNIPLTISYYEIIELSPTKLIIKNKKGQLLEYEIDNSVYFQSNSKRPYKVKIKTTKT
jgi:hypothetical protein